MTFTNMLSLIGVKAQIGNIVICRVFVYVMNYFLRSKVAPKMPFHNKAMLKNIFRLASPRTDAKRMICWRDNQNVSILSDFTPTLPSGIQCATFAEHRVRFALQSLAKHGILRAGNVAIVARIPICKISGGQSAAYGAIFLVRLRRALAKTCLALSALLNRDASRPVGFCAFPRAKFASPS